MESCRPRKYLRDDLTQPSRFIERKGAKEQLNDVMLSCYPPTVAVKCYKSYISSIAGPKPTVSPASICIRNPRISAK